MGLGVMMRKSLEEIGYKAFDIDWPWVTGSTGMTPSVWGWDKLSHILTLFDGGFLDFWELGTIVTVRMRHIDFVRCVDGHGSALVNQLPRFVIIGDVDHGIICGRFRDGVFTWLGRRCRRT